MLVFVLIGLLRIKMLCDPLYWYWKSELPDSVCDAIIVEGMKLTANAATVGGEGDRGKVDTSVRISKTAFFPSTSWVTGITRNYMQQANDQAWKFEITNPQGPQFTIYDTNEHYGFHEDQAILAESMRKLSLIIQLTDPSAYEGGDFEFANCKPEVKERGSILVFPSFLTHKVDAVTSGTRYSLVNWFLGPQFR